MAGYTPSHPDRLFDLIPERGALQIFDIRKFLKSYLHRPYEYFHTRTNLEAARASESSDAGCSLLQPGGSQGSEHQADRGVTGSCHRQRGTVTAVSVCIREKQPKVFRVSVPPSASLHSHYGNNAYQSLSQRAVCWMCAFIHACGH